MGRKGQRTGACEGAIVSNAKRKEIVFTRVELEAMPDRRLKELSELSKCRNDLIYDEFNKSLNDWQKLCTD